MSAAASCIHSYDEQRLAELFCQQRNSLIRQTDRMFAGLMIFQWLAGILMALMVSPRTWIGDTSAVHLHVWAAVFLGGLISSLPILLAVIHPGRTSTRHVIAFAQAAWSALLIHLSGGRIETHFHVFGSLAFIAFYHDWKVIITASVLIAADHFARGIWWPQSVFGVLVESPYRWVEHSAWVVFEDIFLIASCIRGIRESREISRRQAILEATNQQIEAKVEERTQQLRHERDRTETVNLELSLKAKQLVESNCQLANEMAERSKAEAARAELQERFVKSSRMAGMAEVATGILHNVGNVLNSVNVSVSLLMERARTSHVATLVKASDVISQHRDALPAFLSTDSRGQHFPRLLSELSKRLSGQQEQQVKELESLIRHIEHIKEVVNMQQSYAQLQGHVESVNVIDLLEDAVKFNDSGFSRHGIQVFHSIQELPPVVTDKHKVLQILVNLISNAKDALTASGRDNKELTFEVFGDDEHVSIRVRDNGIGISRENLTQIFSHGFTTRVDGHGFGLHSAALAAQELKGSLSVHSDGPGQGAAFTLRLPRRKDESCIT